jgi:hypothetical protein
MKIVLLCLGLVFSCCSMLTAQKTNTSAKPKISNGIKLTLSKGIQLKTAYLFYDGGARVPDSNTASINQNVNMLIQIERGGWQEKEGKVSIGAAEKIVTNTGLKILEEADLFATLTDISAEDAQYVTLKAVITSMTKKFGFFIVSFTIWDKWGTGKITGSYRLKIR